jgi:low temperature requirement protein LtrA
LATKAWIFSAPALWPVNEHHVRRPGWTELFFDLVFAAAISQLSTPLGADYSVQGIVKYAFLLALVFLAWFGFTVFSTQFALDDPFQRALIVAQVFLVAVMAANATGPLNSRDSAGFGAAYGGVRAILALQYLRVIALPGARSLVRRRVAMLLAAAVIWLTSAVLPANVRYAAWAVALLIDIGNSWPSLHGTKMLPPGAVHLPERFGLLTIILLGEFVASVMRGIESQMGWSLFPASTAVLALALGFTIWSCYSDGAHGWETRHVRSATDVRRLRIWIALHFLLFVGLGVLGVGARRAIALPAGEHFSIAEQCIICSAAAGIMLVVMGIAAMSEQHCSREPIIWLAQGIVVTIALSFGILDFRILPAALLFVLFVCFVAQAMLLVMSQQARDAVAKVPLL